MNQVSKVGWAEINPIVILNVKANSAPFIIPSYGKVGGVNNVRDLQCQQALASKGKKELY